MSISSNQQHWRQTNKTHILVRLNSLYNEKYRFGGQS
eukprot:UN02168